MALNDIFKDYGKDIAFTLLGCVIPFLASCLLSIFKYIYILLFRKDRSVFLGTWYVYHYSNENEQHVFIEGIWEMKLSLAGYYAISRDSERSGLAYKGRLRLLKDATLVLLMHGVGSMEEYYVKIKYPIPNKSSVTYGIKVGIDFDSREFATIYLFSRNKLSKSDAIKIGSFQN